MKKMIYHRSTYAETGGEANGTNDARAPGAVPVEQSGD